MLGVHTQPHESLVCRCASWGRQKRRRMKFEVTVLWVFIPSALVLADSPPPLPSLPFPRGNLCKQSGGGVGGWGRGSGPSGQPAGRHHTRADKKPHGDSSCSLSSSDLIFFFFLLFLSPLVGDWVKAATLSSTDSQGSEEPCFKSSSLGREIFSSHSEGSEVARSLALGTF